MAVSIDHELLKTIVNANGSHSGSVRVSSASLEQVIRRHHLFGYAYAYLRDQLSQEFADECRRHYVFQKIAADKYFSELERLNKVFETAGEAAIVYKGGAFMRELYSDFGTRDLKDFDLWVPPEKMKRAQELFFNAGYEIRDVPNWEGGEGKLIYTRTDGDFFTDFEVHQKNYSFERIPLFEIPNGARGFHAPPLEEHFLMIVIHAGYQHTFTELKWWIDIVRFLDANSSQLDWQKLCELSKKHEMHRLLANVLRVVAETRQNFDYPKELFTTVQFRSFSAEFLIKPQQNKIRYFWLKHGLKQNIGRTLLYDLLWLKSGLEQKLFST